MSKEDDNKSVVGRWFTDFCWIVTCCDRPENALHRYHRASAQRRKIVEEIGRDDGVTALQQLGLIKVA
ncbi:MAG: hypothetical protein WCA85_24900 [Paraburkholderia sp.]|uniref:hypothetical protein n=1 Tax=Paraburkholderia sp. TaxID=1926495 RepID=UPI003C476984